ncbi:MAG: HAD family hydrolase [Neisseria sp.]|nr:HAD family hydrolase [Neisseria sp.]
MNEIQQRARAVKILVLDVDGVLTNGQLLMLPTGEEIKAFHTLDGHGIKMLQRVGILTAIITGRDAPATAARVRQLGINHYFAGIADKAAAFAELLQRTALQAADCAYVGDDVPDLPVLQQVGFACAPPEAHATVRQAVHYITQASAGYGAVREVCDMILSAQALCDANGEAHLA